MRILYSTSRIALRSRVLQEVSDLVESDPGQRSILIVPEQTKMDMERDLLDLSNQPGMMMTEILSFRRLAWRFLGEIGRQPRSALDRSGQGMLIHSVLKSRKQDLHTFGHLADRPGFINQVAAALGDLRRYCLDADKLLAAAERADDQALQNKMSDLAVLLAGYEQELTGSGLCDAEDDLARLGELLDGLAGIPVPDWPWPAARLTWISDARVWISGFAELRDFTPQEDRILAALNKLCRQVTLTVAADFLPFDRSAVDAGPDCFLAGRKAAFRLLKDYPASQNQKIAATESGHAAAVSSGILTSGPFQPAEPSNWLKLIRAGDVDNELTWVAGEIRRLTQEDQFRYQDITLAVCDLPSYEPRLRAVFREYGVPLFLDTDRPVSGSPLVRFVLSLLDVGLRGWPLASVMTCLRSGMTPLEPNEIDCLENEILARGITRPDRLFDDRRYSSRDILLWRDAALLPWRETLESLKRASACAQKCRLLHRFLLAYAIPERLEKRSSELLASGESDLAVIQVQAWNELLRVLKQMAELAGETPMSLQTFRDLLAVGLESAGTYVIPTAIDQVAVGDLQRAMLRKPRVLFIIGASADRLPPKLPPEGLLKDQDRQTMAGILDLQIPSSARDQVFADAFTVYTLLTLPESRLYMSVPTDAVSPWFNWLASGEPGCVSVLKLLPDWDDPRLNALRPAFSYLVNHSGSVHHQDAGWLAVGSVLREAGLPIAAAAGWLRGAARPTDSRMVCIDPRLVRAVYGDQPAMSVSQLEKYAGCPFAHLADYLLALQERVIWEPEAAEVGTLLHGVVELALLDLRDVLNKIDPSDRERWEAELAAWLSPDFESRIAAWMRTAAERDGLLVFFETGIRASSGRRVSRLASSSLTAMLRQYGRGSYKPEHLEWRFGPLEKNQLDLSLADGTMIAFRGKVDRVDIRQQEGVAYFRVVDYKSGDRRVDFDALYHGLALQLPAYLEAFGRGNPDYLAEDAAYFRFIRPILSLPAGSRPDDGEILDALEKGFNLRGLNMSPDEIGLIRRHAMRRAGELTDRLFSGRFEIVPRRLPGRLPACEYCRLKALCGFDEDPSGFCWLSSFQSKKRQALIDKLKALEQKNKEDEA